MRRGWFTAAVLAPALLPCPGRADEQVLDLPLGGGLDQHILYTAPNHPRAAIVMLPGGSGNIGLERNGTLGHGDNFLVRTAADWVSRGYAVLIPDTIDHASLRGERSRSDYASVVAGLAAYAQRKARAPVFLLGTSQGSIAAMNGAAHAAPGTIAGVILTESVSVVGHSGETVFDADPQDVKVPALVVANRDDACDVAPPGMAQKIAAAMRNAVDAKVVIVSGGQDADGKPCGSLSPHGYYGIERTVIDDIVTWMQAHGG